MRGVLVEHTLTFRAFQLVRTVLVSSPRPPEPAPAVTAPRVSPATASTDQVRRAQLEHIRTDVEFAKLVRSGIGAQEGRIESLARLAARSLRRAKKSAPSARLESSNAMKTQLLAKHAQRATSVLWAPPHQSNAAASPSTAPLVLELSR